MSELNTEYYKNHYIATVSIRGGVIHVLGGPTEKRLLRLAKKETDTCYVRNTVNSEEVQLILVDGDWVPTKLN